ncbi:MAG: outer membrane protein assembly factor BamD [Candidatus Krumholzibacteriota bacterium]|nr:outer membrane protein assembly factor BamD [Candidatus Krumholzibacteriota bacterium]
MRCRDRSVRRPVAFIAAFLALASCGGPYKGQRVPEPGQKIAIADARFERKDYGKAAVEYKDFLASFAGNERVDYAQYRLAESYRLDGDFALAAVEYRILINDYGYSEYVDDAFLLEAVCAFAQAPRVERDQTKVFEARSRIVRFIQLFPDSPRRAEADELLARIDDRLAEKDYRAASLYFGRKRWESAEIYFDKIVENYPGTRWAGMSWYRKGIIHEQRGETAEAVRAYGEALSSAAEFEGKDDAADRLRALSGEGSGDGDG